MKAAAMSTELGAYRAYLRFLANHGLAPKIRQRVDPSDVVQQTLLEAHRSAEDFQSRRPAEVAAWLRKILARNLAKAGRDNRRQKRDVGRERSLDADLNRSSLRLAGLLVSDEPSPSERAMQHERAVQLAAAIDEISEDRREALVLYYWRGWTFVAIAERLGVSRFVVARLVREALGDLKTRLTEFG